MCAISRTPARAGVPSPKARNHIRDVRVGGDDVHVFFWKTGSEQPCGYRLRRAAPCRRPAWLESRRALRESLARARDRRPALAAGPLKRRTTGRNATERANPFFMAPATVPICCACASESMFTQISLIFPFSIRKMSIPLTSILRAPCVPRITQRVATLLPSASSSSSVKCKSGNAPRNDGNELAEIRDAFDDGRRIAKHHVGRNDRIDRGRAALVENLVEISPRDRLGVGRRLRSGHGRKQDNRHAETNPSQHSPS